MALTTDQQTELDSLNAALLAARRGQLPSKVVYQGRETEFAKVDLADLKNRVVELNGLAASTTGRTRGAIRFRFR